jgi:hypothetical protein
MTAVAWPPSLVDCKVTCGIGKAYGLVEAGAVVVSRVSVSLGCCRIFHSSSSVWAVAFNETDSVQTMKHAHAKAFVVRLRIEFISPQRLSVITGSFIRSVEQCLTTCFDGHAKP